MLPLAAEAHFSLDLGDVVLEGRIDQINRSRTIPWSWWITRPAGPSQKDADKSLQLSVYALAARDQMHLNPPGLHFIA